MHHDNRSIPSIDGTSNCTLGKRPPSAKSQRGQSAKITPKNRSLYTQRKNAPSNMTVKEQSGRSAFHRKHFTEQKKIDPKDQIKSRDKCSNDAEYDDAIAALHREIEDWKISEALTSRTEERFTGTPSEHRTFSYVASGETTKRQRSPSNPLKSVRTYIDFLAATNKPNVVDYLDLQKGPAVPQSAVCHRKMHSQSSCDCYCRPREPTYLRRNGIQSDRSRVKLVTSKTSVCKTDSSRSGRNVPLTPAHPVNDDQLDSKRSATIPPIISPVLSPETSVALENVDRLVKDAEIQIKAINMVSDCNAFQTPVKTYSAEVSLDDENDQLLYIRERVASKFQEANGWPDSNYNNPENEGTSYERKLRARPKKITDFSAPKFKMLEERCKEFRRCSSFGAQDPGMSAVDTQSRERRAKGPIETPNLERNSRLKTLSYQACPTVNIERQLTAQNLDCIHISPDPSFIQQNANVGTYIVSHGCKPRSQTRKEKFVKIFEEPKDAASGKQLGERKKKNGRTTNEVENSNESSQSSVSKGSPAECREKTDVEDTREQEEGAAISVENKNLESMEDSAASFNNRKSEDREVQVEIEMLEERTDDRAGKDAGSVRSDHKQVRFSEEVREDIVKPEARDDKERNKCIESEDESVPGHNFDPLGGNEEEYEKKKKKTDDEKSREHYKIIEQNFASLHRKYCNQNDQSVEESPSLLESSNVDTSGEASEGSADEELYHPAIEELDNVLLAYNKIIDDASQSIRTIDKYLTRPELREYLQNDAASQSSESPLQRNDSETPKRKSVRDQRVVKHRHMNETRRTCRTMSQAKGSRSVKLQSARFNKLDYNSENKCIPRKSLVDTPSRGDAKIRRRTGKDPRISSNVETALTESDSGKIAKHIEKTLAKFFQVQRSRDVNSFRSDESSSLTTSMNPSVASTDTQSVGEDKLGANVLEEDSSPPSNAAIAQNFEQQAEERASLEDKIKDALDLEEMMPILVKNLLQNFQNGATSSPHNLELLITETAPENNVESNVHEVETARVKTDDESEKKCSKSGVDVTEKNANDELVRDNADFVDKSASRSSNSEQHAACMKQENSAAEPNKINSNTEPLRELVSEKNDSTLNKKMEHGVTGNNDGSPDVNRTDERMQSNVSVPVREGTASEAMNNLSEKNKETEGTRPQDSVNEDLPSKPSPRVENEKIESCLDQSNAKIPVEYNDSRTSSSDSLRDCVSLQSSLRNEPKLLRTMESTSKINESDQLMEINNAGNSVSNRVFNEKHPRGHTFEKEKILSDLYDEIHEQLLHSTFATNLVQQNTRILEDMPPTVSQTVESVSLDTSRSEGELFMPSSGSCSLGEVKMLNTNEQDNIITVFVTKETLSLWSESSKSLVQSIGEI